MKLYEDQIEVHTKKLKGIIKTSVEVQQKFGLRGKDLIECLTSIRKFAKDIKAATEMYAPLISVLKG